MTERLIFLANGLFEPEPVPFVPDGNGNPPVPRALIPLYGAPCACPRCAAERGSFIYQKTDNSADG
jgi:hypothetical protein